MLKILIRKFFVMVSLIIFLLINVNQVHAVDPKFRRPMNIQPSPLVNYYYDNQSGSSTKIYTCASSPNYDGHQGTDFKTPQIGNYVYAGANGGLYYSFNNCPTYGSWYSTCGNYYGNHAKIDHEGNLMDGIGWVTVYAHMSQNTVAYPMSVLCGSSIGLSGSSGKSTGPHLHFEVKKYSYPGNDPFSGNCSHPTSFWVNQNGGTPTTQCQ